MTITKPLLLGLGLVALVGCDTAEQAAESLVKKVEEAAVEQVRESLGETLDKLNEGVDQAQEDSRRWLDQTQPQPDQEQPQQEAEKQMQTEMIET